jgi:hypothetical protein
MAKDDFGDDFDRGAGSGGLGRCVSSQVVGSHFQAHPLACPFHNVPACSVLYRKDAAVWIDLLFLNIALQPLCNLLRDEDNLLLLAALLISQYELPVFHVPGCKLKRFTDPKPSSGHKFHEQPITNSEDFEDDLIHGLFVQNLPMGTPGNSEELPQESRIAGILPIEVKGVPEEGEECGKGRIPASLGCLSVPFTKLGQEGENLI